MRSTTRAQVTARHSRTTSRALRYVYESRGRNGGASSQTIQRSGPAAPEPSRARGADTARGPPPRRPRAGEGERGGYRARTAPAIRPASAQAALVSPAVVKSFATG